MTRGQFMDKAQKCVLRLTADDWINLYIEASGNGEKLLEDQSYKDACEFFKYFKKKEEQYFWFQQFDRRSKRNMDS